MDTFFLDELQRIRWEVLLAGAIRLVVIAVGILIARRLIEAGTRRVEKSMTKQETGAPLAESSRRAQTLMGLVRQALVIVLYVAGALVALAEVGVDVGPLLAGAGVVGLAVSFGSQNLVRDVISGFFLLMEDQVRVGDIAEVNGIGGIVEKINFRTMVLRDIAGAVHYFPNGTITTLTNQTSGWSAYVMDIGIAYDADPDQAMEVMRQVAEELKEDAAFGDDILEPLEIFGVDAFADSAVMIKARLKTSTLQQFRVGREYRRRLKKAFDRAGIEIPFPQRTLHVVAGSLPKRAEVSRE